MNRVPAYAITLILGNKQSLRVVRYFLVWLFYEKVIVRRPLHTILQFFALCKISNLYLHRSLLYYYCFSICLDDPKFAYILYYSLLCQVEYVKLSRFRLMELYYKTVILSAQVGFEGTYGHVLVHRWNLYVFEVVLVIFEKGQQNFALFRTFRTQCEMSIFGLRRS